MFIPIAEVDSEVVTIRYHSRSIVFAVDDKVIRLDTRSNSYDTIYTTPNNSIIHGFDIDYNDVYVHYRDGNIHKLVNGNNVIANIDDPDGRMSTCFDTVLTVNNNNNRWLLWAVGNVMNQEDMDTQDLSSNLRSQYGKLYRYSLRTNTTSDILAYGIRGINGMLYNRNLYVAHNGYNWRSVYMLDIYRNNQYLGWRYYDGPLPTLRKIDNQGWITVYPDTTTVPLPIKPKLTYSPTMRPVGTGYIKGIVYYNGKLRYLDSDIGIIGINLGNVGHYTAVTNNSEDTVYISRYSPDYRLWIIGQVNTKNHRQDIKMSHKHVDSSTEEIRKLAKIFERSKLRSSVGSNTGVSRIINISPSPPTTPPLSHHHRHYHHYRHRHSKR